MRIPEVPKHGHATGFFGGQGLVFGSHQLRIEEFDHRLLADDNRRCGADALPFLGTAYSERIFEGVKEQFDTVLFDAPSDEAFSGTLGLCLQADGVLWVVRSGNWEDDRLEETLGLYQEAGVNLLGAALNRAQPGESNLTSQTASLQ
jgi:hypothetical protein